MNTILCLAKQELFFKNIFGQFFENFDHSDVVEFTFLLLLLFEFESKIKKGANVQLEIRTLKTMRQLFKFPHLVSASKK